MVPRSHHHVALLVAATLLTATAASARDDWPQFHHDAQRSGFSADSIPGRLTELWNWQDSSQASRAPGFLLAKSNRTIGPCAIWEGRIYAISLENQHPVLVCAHVMTGLRLWQQPLNGWAGCRPDVGPAVTRSGIVYAYDTVPLNERQVHHVQEALAANKNRDERRKMPVIKDFPASHVRLRAFSAVTGEPLGEHALPDAFPRRQFNPLITRLMLGDSIPSCVALLPGPESHWALPSFPALGPALLSGNQLVAASEGDLVVRWQPGAPAEITRLCHKILSSEVPSAAALAAGNLNLFTPANLGGFPLAQHNADLVIADDRTKRFIGLLGMRSRWETFSQEPGSPGIRQGSGTTLAWHLDPISTVGAPSVVDNTIVLGLGGLGAQNAVAGIDAESGAVRWAYPELPGKDATTTFKDRWVAPKIGGRLVAPDEGFAGTWDFKPRLGLWPHRPQERRLSVDSDDYEIWLPRVQSLSGQLANVSAVTRNERAYAVVGNELVALKSGDGQLVWKRPLRNGTRPSALIGTREHLVVLQDSGAKKAPLLLGISRETGRLEWTTRLERPGQLVTAYSLLFVCENGQLTAFAPAERTFRLAIDSERSDDYRRDPPEQPEVAEAAPDNEAKPAVAKPEASDDPEQPVTEPEGLGDASLLRLQWGEATDTLVHRIRTRRATAPGVPLTLVLDWLNRTRSDRVNAAGTGGWTPVEIAAFANLCAKLAAVAQPEHFEVGSEVNVYLARHPEEVERVRVLVRAARAAVTRVSPHTRVLISYNSEVLGDVYGRTHYFPFGDLPTATRKSRLAALSLAADVEEVGLTTRPQSGFVSPSQIGPRYLLARKLELGNKPVLITHMEARFDESDSAAITQSQFLKRLFQVSYWLDARLVAYPALYQEHGPEVPDVALQIGPTRRPALSYWKDTFGWKRVDKLTTDPTPIAPGNP